jgi:hypothetical protein
MAVGGGPARPSEASQVNKQPGETGGGDAVNFRQCRAPLTLPPVVIKQSSGEPGHAGVLPVPDISGAWGWHQGREGESDAGKVAHRAPGALAAEVMHRITQADG